MPENMSRKFYEWPDLVQLYRDADVIAVCLVDNKYAAGVQGLLEAMAASDRSSLLGLKVWSII